MTASDDAAQIAQELLKLPQGTNRPLAWDMDVLVDYIAQHTAAAVQAAHEVTGETSDGYHTFNELYAYREAYNAAWFNMMAQDISYWGVHKSWKHSDGGPCFGGGWFIVMAELPTGQISNHYEAQYWDDFQIPEKPVADKWDGHTPEEALQRIKQLQADTGRSGEES